MLTGFYQSTYQKVSSSFLRQKFPSNTDTASSKSMDHSIHLACGLNWLFWSPDPVFHILHIITWLQVQNTGMSSNSHSQQIKSKDWLCTGLRLSWIKACVVSSLPKLLCTKNPYQIANISSWAAFFWAFVFYDLRPLSANTHKICACLLWQRQRVDLISTGF